ncbi:hypothetical protein BH18THE2_BH18THE2_11740 [soil metagenome]
MLGSNIISIEVPPQPRESKRKVMFFWGFFISSNPMVKVIGLLIMDFFRCTYGVVNSKRYTKKFWN